MDFTIEELSMNAWPSIQTMLYDGWIIRMANGYTKRANSINPIYNPTTKLDEKIEYGEKLYGKYNLPTVFKIIECEEYKLIDKKLETLNYELVDLTSVQVCKEIRILENNFPGIIIDTEFNTKWINGFIECGNIKKEHQETIKTMLKNITGDKIVIYKESEGNIAGCGYGVIENNFVGIFDIIVNETERGKGYGKEIVKTILSEAGKQGIGESYLQVVDTNIIAKNLYKKLGYKEEYKYWYRKK
jgi:ribosomal protein S18 acetylase RimI-like enzyme